ncbi:MAG: hypothetical protein FIB07_16560 [Candidatus Methanoperedens sp.]|nr:hypothetical protein [Candidatus Methanoperedens sp.]
MNEKKRILSAVIIIFLLIFGVSNSDDMDLESQDSKIEIYADANFQKKAAIIDQLFQYQNMTFVETATDILNQSGYTVDYFSNNITVDFYRNLPDKGYNVIIFRVHSLATYNETTNVPVSLFTSERYDKNKYIYESLTDRLSNVIYSQYEYKKGISYFGINPSFISDSTKGNFQDTIVITMGCEGLRNNMMARAFIEKGAIVYIGWNSQILASKTDSTTINFMEHFFLEKLTLRNAIRETFNETGGDHQNFLYYYPVKMGYIKSE